MNYLATSNNNKSSTKYQQNLAFTTMEDRATTAIVDPSVAFVLPKDRGGNPQEQGVPFPVFGKNESDESATSLLDNRKHLHINKTSGCGDRYFVYKCDHCNREFRVRATCKKRTCLDCAKLRGYKLWLRYRDLLEAFRWPAHVVLTLKSVPYHHLTSGYDKIIKTFGKLRRRKIWRVDKGIYTIELTLNDDRDAWHIHLHAIVDCRWISQERLSDQWRDLTGDSYVVYIDRIRNIRKASRELFKYITKIWQIPIPDRAFVEKELKNRRFIGKFGDIPLINLESLSCLLCPICNNELRFLRESPYRDSVAFLKVLYDSS